MPSLISQSVEIFLDGGPLMYPLLVQTVVIYYCIVSLYLDLFFRRFGDADENTWRHWVDKPEEGTGELGEVIRYAAANAGTMETLRASFGEIRNDYIPAITRRMRFSAVLVSTAPLAGLLGTVTGMLTTFDRLSAGSGAGTASVVAGGIAEALITTMTGLVIAIPGLVLLSRIRSMRDALELFFLRLENAFVRREMPRRLVA